MPKKTIAVVFLCFSIVVAFANVLVGKYFLLGFIVPFALACLLRGLPSRLFEIVGLYFVSMYFVVFESLQFGILGLIIMSCFVYALNYRLILSRAVIYTNSIVLFVVSYARADGVADKLLHAGLDAAFYAIGAFSLYCVFTRAIDEHKSTDKPLEQKSLSTIEDLQRVAHELIEIVKSMQGGKK